MHEDKGGGVLNEVDEAFELPAIPTPLFVLWIADVDGVEFEFVGRAIAMFIFH